MSTTFDENLGKKILSTVIKNEKNIEILNKYIQKHSSPDTYLVNAYQVIGMIKKDGNIKKTGQNLKDGLFGWKNPVFSEIASKIEEHDEYLEHPFEIVEGVTECGKCGSKRTWNVQKQTRGQDEPMTTFSRCVECGNQWAYSG